MRPARSGEIVVLVLCLSFASSMANEIWAEEASAISIDVDARELPRRLVHTTLVIPSKPGPMRLWYPKWIPGSHGPKGRVEDIGGLRVETADGVPIPWKRDEIDLHCFAIKVPDGTTAVRVKLDTICEASSAEASGIYTYAATHRLGHDQLEYLLGLPGRDSGRRTNGERPPAIAIRLEICHRFENGLRKRWQDSVPSNLAEHVYRQPTDCRAGICGRSS